MDLRVGNKQANGGYISSIRIMIPRQNTKRVLGTSYK